MNYRHSFLLLLALPLSMSGVDAQDLATVSAKASMTAEPGRTVVSARNHHFIIDAPPPLGGPNEAINPIEILMSALGSCSVLVSEKVAQEHNISLQGATATVEGDLDPRGVRGADVNPRIQAFRIMLHLDGATEAEAETLIAAIKKRCPVYTTLARSAPIDLQYTLKQ